MHIKINQMNTLVITLWTTILMDIYNASNKSTNWTKIYDDYNDIYKDSYLSLHNILYKSKLKIYKYCANKNL